MFLCLCVVYVISHYQLNPLQYICWYPYLGSWSDVSKMLKLHKQKNKSGGGRAVNKHLQKLLPSMLPKDFWTNNCTPWKSADSSLKEAAITIFNIKVELSLMLHVH